MMFDLRCLVGRHPRYSSKIALTEQRGEERQLHVGGRCASCGKVVVLRSFGWVSKVTGVTRAEKRRVARSPVKARG
jgi:hypothetical protein